MMLSTEVQAVLSFYALDVAAVQIDPVGNAGGWSGSRLWRIGDASRRELCLRRWPKEHPTKDRLRLIHDVLKAVSAELPIAACPLPARHGATFVEHGGHLWELTPWLPGAADYHLRPSRARLRAAIAELARFHNLAARYETRSGAAPAVLDRQRQWTAMRDKGVALIERSLGTPLGKPIDDRAAGLLAAASQALQRQAIIESLAAIGDLLLQPAIRDIHQDHVLFTGDEVTGLIDFGALRIDTPLADIARLVGSLVGDDTAERQFAVDAYSDVRPVSREARRVVDLLDHSGVVLGALNWLMWLYVERRDMGPVQPIVNRLDGLVMRLHRINAH